MTLGTIMTLCLVVGMWVIFVPRYWLFSVLLLGVAFAIPTIVICSKALRGRREPQIVVLRGCAVAVLCLGIVVSACGLIGTALYNSACYLGC